MRAEQKTDVKNSVGRLVFAGISVLIQIAWLLFLIIKLNRYSTWISIFTSVLALVMVLRIYGKHSNAAMKMPWIMIILVFPLMGVSLYLLVGNSFFTKKMRARFAQIDEGLGGFLIQDQETMERLK